MTDQSMAADAIALAERTREFVREHVIPFERDPRNTRHGPTDELRCELNALAKTHGLFAPHVAKRWGGKGLDHRAKALVFEAAGYSPLGPVAIHCAAPDEGNMHLLEAVASEAHQERWLKHLAAGDMRSIFCMTEPHPGAGSDPGQMVTTAHKQGDFYVVNGRKWLITGADGAGVGIVMVRVEGEGGGPTMLMTDLPVKGMRIERTMESIDSSFTGGHAEVVFENCMIPVDQVLGEVGKGFEYAQVRLAPARLTHCMRWLGACERANEVARDYALQRRAFGKRLVDHEGVGFMLADNAIDLNMTRLAISQVAALLDSGEAARIESSMAKVFSSEALFRVADRCVQVMGGVGLTSDSVVEQVFRETRAFRVYDGPSEVHRWAIAKSIVRNHSRELA